MPDAKVSNLNCNANTEINIFNVIEIEKFNNYYRLIRVVCRIFSIFKSKKIAGILEEPCGESVRNIEDFLIMEVQKSLGNWNDKYKCLSPTLQNGLIVVGQRISKWLKDNWNQDYFILLVYFSN